MANERETAAWSRMANLLCMLYSIHRDPKKTTAKSPSDFNPYAAKEKPIEMSMAEIGQFFRPK